jgi:DNA repair protein RecN (Recombination protein N)
MLELLHIENVAVIERAEITFGAGLNVLTGETGAGKSIVIDALSAVTGGRTSKELVRTDAPGASVTAEFSEDGAGSWLEENGVERGEAGSLLLTRRITADGKNTCRVNGAPVTVAQLRELGGLLIDIHGQNDGHKLLDEGAHRAYLDAFGGHGALLERYATAYAATLEKRRELDAAHMDESEKERRADTLRRQIEELTAAKLKSGEASGLEERRTLLMNASRLTQSFDGAYYALYGGEDTDGAVALIAEASSGIDGAARYSESFAALAARLKDLRFTAEDIAEELRDLRSGFDFSPEELDKIEERLDLLRRVTRKYGGDEASALEFLEKYRAELDDVEYSAEREKRLGKELAERINAAAAIADELSERRKTAAIRLQARITEELSHLNMAGVRFAVEFAPTAGEYGLSRAGREDARFLMSANAGESPGRISRIASGGELSRIMLALKNVLSESDAIPSMVFDEVDAGVSGIAAQRVGEKLADLARRRQVLCVTHLPQIAVMADTHFEISKSADGGRTYTHVAALDYEGRKAELARLSGGENVTLTTLSSAAEQLAAAERYKNPQKS